MISRLHFVRKVVKLFVRLLACLAVGKAALEKVQKSAANIGMRCCSSQY